ncbi:MAG: hypothetical protein WKF37_03405 [Bryobacteraceae bacterium]
MQRIFEPLQIAGEVPQYREMLETVETQFGGASDRVRFQEALRLLIDWLVTGLIDGTSAAVRSSGVETIDDIRKHASRLVCFTPEAELTNASLKRFLHRRLYFSELLVEERRKSVESVAQLFQFFLLHPQSLPEHYQEAESPLHRVICDYIAGMTDGYFGRIYLQVIGDHSSGLRVT